MTNPNLIEKCTTELLIKMHAIVNPSRFCAIEFFHLITTETSQEAIRGLCKITTAE